MICRRDQNRIVFVRAIEGVRAVRIAAGERRCVANGTVVPIDERDGSLEVPGLYTLFDADANKLVVGIGNPRGKRWIGLWRFAEIGIKDVAIVEGKNASLGEMYRELAGKSVKVSNGFAITAAITVPMASSPPIGR
ncbi:MAG: hypothetical protein V3T69_05535 [Acidiferrobacterales bacterium]